MCPIKIAYIMVIFKEIESHDDTGLLLAREAWRRNSIEELG